MAFGIFALKASLGTIAICPLPGRFSPLAQDLAAIRAWRPAIVVSLTQAADMAGLQADGLGRCLAAAGIEWAHMPIPDFGVPEEGGSQAWPTLSERLHGILDGGGKVLLHCFGGQGRSGMVALRLLVEQGEAPEAALSRLRAVRPGAVETDAQNHWAATAKPGSAALPKS